MTWGYISSVLFYCFRLYYQQRFTFYDAILSFDRSGWPHSDQVKILCDFPVFPTFPLCFVLASKYNTYSTTLPTDRTTYIILQTTITGAMESVAKMLIPLLG